MGFITKTPQNPKPSTPQPTIAPGLLHVFRLAAWIRLAFVVVVVLLVVAWRLPGQWLGFAVLAESALFLIVLSWPRTQLLLGRAFLPVMLAWSLASPLLMRILLVGGYWLESGLAGPASGTTTAELADFNLFVDAGFNLAWLAVPVVLATWQYGRRGLNVAMAVVVAGNLLAVLLPENTPAARAALLVDLAGRLAIIGLVAIVVERLAAAQRREQTALEEANRRLAARAATVEQLTESRERNRLAREMHDTLAHSLTGLSVQLQALGRLMTSDPDAAQAQLVAAQTTVRDGIGEARRSIQALRATPLADLGLSEALRQLCRSYAERLAIDFDCVVDEVGALDPATEQAIYRTAEAALANVEQHAGAAQVGVRLARTEEALALTVRDDGAGFDVATVAGDRYGLAGMRERAAEIGATLDVRSTPGAGTEVSLRQHTLNTTLR
ncbi:MAG: sensor histidine kinase [Caldilinea sp.]|nr:sensor histidine kinase [Caldilineaceae bacterium]MCO5211365.1 sensor histidine kinase [Caldilinea sp.]